MYIRHWSRRAAFVTVFVTCSLAAFAATEPVVKHVRGTVATVAPDSISVTTSTGKTQTIAMNDETKLFLVKAADINAITPDRFVGVTSVEQDGRQVAREVHVFAEELRGIGEGHYPWDLEDTHNDMTNANVGKIETVGADRVLKLDYKDGSQTIAVPPNASIVLFDNATRDKLAVGSKVFVIVKPQADGSMLGAAVVVGANGLKPPM